MQQKCYKQKQVANTDHVNNLARQWSTLHHHAQYWQKNMTVCVQLQFNTCMEIMGAMRQRTLV